MIKKFVPQKPKSIPFTQLAYQKMEKKFADLTEERTKILVRLQTAREMGDLSENGAYKYAKFELGNTDRELRRLTHLLKYGKVTKNKKTGKVDFGSKITLQKDGVQTTFTMVNHHESNPQKQKLSTDSPIGKAVMGKKVGDKITVTAPAGETTYTLTKIG